MRRMLHFFCGRWPPDSVLESSIRQVNEVIGAHSNLIDGLYNRVRFPGHLLFSWFAYVLRSMFALPRSCIR